MKKLKLLVVALALIPSLAYAQSYSPPPPPPPDAAPAPQQSGRWVYTQEYGWVWMPAGDQYVSAGPNGPVAYVFGVGLGWRWVAAPWLWGPGFYHHRWYPHRYWGWHHFRRW